MYWSNTETDGLRIFGGVVVLLIVLKMTVVTILIALTPNISILSPDTLKWVYESFSDVGESRVWFASKNLTPCRMH